MCGIAGFSGRYSRELLTRMSRVISHRGPDADGFLYDDNKGIGLAHRRLAIIDLSSAGRQPMWDISHSVCIVFNGEIYNYRELAKELSNDGYKFRSKSDTEVILNLYLRDGVKLLEQLNGIFAFAIWDPRNDELFLARDGIGVKPLYYTETPQGFLFASEIKSLLQDKGVDRSLDPTAIHHYLTYLWSPAPDTMLKSVKKLEPGFTLIVQHGKIKRKSRYYDLPYKKNIEEISVKEAIHEVHASLITAVKRQMIADVPVGAFLSGGLDSSSVVAIAKNYLADRQKLQCFTIGFRDNNLQKEGIIDDLPYAQKVAKHLNVDLHTIYVGSELIDQLQKMIYHLDEPQADPAPLNALLISELANKHNIKVLLSGAGGDDIFTGYRRHFALLSEKYWDWLPVNGRRLLAQLSKKLPKQLPSSRRLAKAFQYADLNSDERLVSYFFWSNRNILFNLYNKEFFKEIFSDDYREPLLASLSRLPSSTPALNKMLYLEGKHFLPDHNLNYTDKMSMATGVEVRVPLLDPDLVALAARLPLSYKQRGRTGKWIFKKAMEPYLPHDVIYRPKTGFCAPLRRWLNDELKELVDHTLSRETMSKRDIFNPDSVTELVHQDRIGRIDGSYTIFSLLCIELWCTLFLDGNQA